MSGHGNTEGFVRYRGSVTVSDSMGKLAVLSVAAAALAVLIGERLITLRHLSLAYRELTQNYLPNCHHIEGIECGAEDIAILENGLAFLSTCMKHPDLPSLSDDPGRIYTLNLLEPDQKIKALNIKGDFDKDSFNPHGISVYTDDKDGAVYLFVVNHPQGNSQVEIFRFVGDENALQYIKTIRHELLHDVNDIVAVDTESFYATNDHYFTNGILKFVEPFLTLPWCDVVYYSPQTVQVVAGGFLIANGINISPDKRYLYVANLLKHKIVVFEIQESTVLSHVKEVDVESLCDNIEVDRESGDLWVGGHPNGIKWLFHDPNDPPGSEVIRIENILSESPRVTQVFADNGSMIIASSVAAPYGGKLLIGTVYQKALICDLK
ncbi:serum paraoxonase/arylesterase 2-like [Garra rufa]|uniref:serum paraoxonase/arylesterase 2-like n=1 Tax=Garra rufa TaxID=137080 RepID=UPI003CCEC378